MLFTVSIYSNNVRTMNLLSFSHYSSFSICFNFENTRLERMINESINFDNLKMHPISVTTGLESSVSYSKSLGGD